MPRIYRIRYIPSEVVDLSSDTLLFRDQHYLITEWKPIKPRNDIAWGISCAFLENGWKISAFMDKDKQIKYWYCDIVDIDYNQESDTYNLYDLLIDVKIMVDGKVEVIDLDELGLAYESGLITRKQMLLSLKQSSSLLKLIYSSDLPASVQNIIYNTTGRRI
jgi:predicted RNA-binding protein associated with RNAse of E/G family